MYVLAKENNVKFPYSITNLIYDNPQISFPETVTDEVLRLHHVFPVVSTKPEYDPDLKVAVQSGCIYNAELQQWETAWVVRDKTTEEIDQEQQKFKQGIVNATQDKLDSFARTRNYDSILSACTYATSTVLKFKTEGQYCVEARDATWSKLYEILSEIQSGTRPAPAGYADIESELPALIWPA